MIFVFKIIDDIWLDWRNTAETSCCRNKRSILHPLLENVFIEGVGALRMGDGINSYYPHILTVRSRGLGRGGCRVRGSWDTKIIFFSPKGYENFFLIISLAIYILHSARWLFLVVVGGSNPLPSPTTPTTYTCSKPKNKVVGSKPLSVELTIFVRVFISTQRKLKLLQLSGSEMVQSWIFKSTSAANATAQPLP